MNAWPSFGSSEICQKIPFHWVGDSVDFWVFITDKESQCPILMSETHTLAKHTRTLLH